MQTIPQINQPPNIIAGFKNPLGPQPLPVIPQPVPQITLPPPQIEVPQITIPQSLSIPEPILPPIPKIIDTIAILGYNFQKKYVYIALIIVLGILTYFIWKWWVGPQKKKKGKKMTLPPQDDDEEDYEEEVNEEEEDDDEIFIPQYQQGTQKE